MAEKKKASDGGGRYQLALAGLKADVLSGGLTMGGGLLAGGLLGALGGAGLARGINVIRGGGPPWVGWSAEAMGPLVESALLRYLAVAHFGRGRGEWAEGEAPMHWRDVVTAALAPRQAALQALWLSRSARLDAPDERERLFEALHPLLRDAACDVLQALYPDDWPAVAAPAAAAPVPVAPPAPPAPPVAPAAPAGEG